MKRLLLVPFLLLASAVSAQTTHVVDNNLGAPTGANVYTTFAAAHAASFDGDTIQFVPSPTNYGNISVTRRLTIRGANFRPRVEQAGYTVNVGAIGMDRILDPIDPHDPSGSRFEGIIFSHIGVVSDSRRVNNVIVSSCIFDSSYNFYGNNLLISNSIFNNFGTDFNWTTNVTIRNNIIFAHVNINVNTSQASTFSNIDHNLFVYQNNNTRLAGRSLIVTNNIFMDRVAAANTTFNSVFTNNISFSATDNALPAVGVSNSGTGNIINQNPRLISFPSTTTRATVLTTNPRLQATSPALNAATDGTQMGPFGGTNPFTAFYNGGSITPYVTVLNVTSTVFEGDPLQVGLTAVGSLPEPPPGSPGLTDFPVPSEAPAFDAPPASEAFGTAPSAPVLRPQFAPAETAPAPAGRPRTDAPTERRTSSDQ